ncbi:MAG: lamin tail domain-containing protein [Deltaproteobacteria bacterium]|nr:lamin tail domain-containing protein [Deltaproteobacteria bacterium]
MESALGRSHAAPDVELVSPRDGDVFLREGEPIEVLGIVFDEFDAPVDLRVWWVLDGDDARPDVVDEAGEVAAALDPAALAVGVHTLTLNALDSDGETAAITVEFGVQGSEDDPDDPDGPDDPDDPDDPDPVSPRAPFPGDLVVSEMMIDPTSVPDELGEWVEVYNTSSDPIELDGLVLRDDDLDLYEISGSVVVPPGQYAVVCADSSPVWNGMVPCDGER